MTEDIFDLGCHGYTHKSANEMTKEEYSVEIADAIDYLRIKFPSQKVLTFAAPYNTTNLTYLAFLDDYAISCRVGNGTQAYLGKQNDMYDVKAFGFSEDSNFENIQSQTDYLVNDGAWVVYFFHTVTDGEPYEAVGTSKAKLDAHCKVLYEKYNGRVWFASFEEVSIYEKQLQNVKMKPTDLSGDSMIFTVDTTLDTDIYNIPMTFKVYVPSTSETAYANVNGVSQDIEAVQTDENGSFIYVYNVPTSNATVEICLL